MKIECYEGSSGLWSWHLKSGNNQVVARADDSYTNRAGVARAATAFADKFKEPPEVVYIPIEPATPADQEAGQ